MKKKKPGRRWRSALLVPSVFVIIISGAFIWGVYRLRLVAEPEAAVVPKSAEMTAAGLSLRPKVTAPTVDQYRSLAITAIRPFMEQAAAYLPDKPVPTDATLAGLAADTQASLLKLTVPAGERPAHLALVLMLDQWKRAASGSRLDSRRAAASAAKVIGEYPWVR